MTANETNTKIARWLGMKARRYDGKSGTFYTNLPKFDTNSTAIQLLPELVARGYTFRLYYTTENGYDFVIWGKKKGLNESIEGEASSEPTIHEAITSALTSLIERSEG